MIKRVWKDPVWSNVIATVITMAIPVCISYISAKIKDISFYDSWINLWNLNLKLWWVAIAVIIYILIKYLKTKKSKKLFLDYRQGEWGNIQWEWDWEYNNKSKKYTISNLNKICPSCKEGFFTVKGMYSRSFDCIKCMYSAPIRSLGNVPSTDQVIKEIRKIISKNFLTEEKDIDWYSL